MTPSEEGIVPASPAGVHGEWLTLLEDLLGGTVHATNNAITALTVLLELSAMEGEVIDQPMLAREFARVQDMTATTALLCARFSKAEALELRAVLDVAIGIHAQHRHLRDIECVVRPVGILLPVRVPRSELLRLLLLMIDSAKRSRIGGTAVSINLSGDEEHLAVHVATATEPGDDMRAFAESCGGEVRQVDGMLRLVLPSLVALRRSERAT